MLNFTPEQPFGVPLYPIFEKAYETVMQRPASSFAFTPGVTPLSTVLEVAVSCVIYFVAIFGGQVVMKSFSAMNTPVVKAAFQVHNVLLTAVSAALLVLLVEQVFPNLYHHGLFYALCEPSAFDQKSELIYYMNYLVKYWELLDTCFLVAKKKKLEFLHYYHHSLTMVLCYTQLVGKSTVSWVPIVLNLTVHVLMYYYYYRTAAGAKIWWKKYLTTMQITQFVIDLAACYFCTYCVFTYTYMPFMPNWGPCGGTPSAAVFGCGLLSSYLVLFINFYGKTYNNKQKLAKSKAAAAGKLQ
ncbi:ELO family [Gongronella butleri]|nr:ELO family [Gongronella butleri]